ncbi:MAG: hypothetical protein SFU25_11620 [Candidatus Caenarcaniphilales bacterium]|nr:hypothetical protein [Candidatus Caenarcaniphilales bacterium]
MQSSTQKVFHSEYSQSLQRIIKIGKAEKDVNTDHGLSDEELATLRQELKNLGNIHTMAFQVNNAADASNFILGINFLIDDPDIQRITAEIMNERFPDTSSK